MSTTKLLSKPDGDLQIKQLITHHHFPIVGHVMPHGYFGQIKIGFPEAQFGNPLLPLPNQIKLAVFPLNYCSVRLVLPNHRLLRDVQFTENFNVNTKSVASAPM